MRSFRWLVLLGCSTVACRASHELPPDAAAGRDSGPPADCILGTAEGPTPERPEPASCTLAVTTDSPLCKCAEGCPVLGDAIVRCDEGGSFDIAAASADRGYLLQSQGGYGNHKVLATIDLTGPSTLDDAPAFQAAVTEPLPLAPSFVEAGPDGQPHVFVEAVEGIGIAHAERRVGGWVAEPVTDADHPSIRDVVGLDSALVDAMNRVLVVYANRDTVGFTLATRSPAGAWSRRQILGDVDRGVRLSPAPGGGLYMTHWELRAGPSLALVYSLDDHEPATVFVASPPAGIPSDLVSMDDPLLRPLVVASPFGRGVHLFTPGASVGFDEAVVVPWADSGVAGCPSPGEGCSGGVVCTETEDSGPYGSELERTADGSIWLGHLEHHLERVRRYDEACGDGCACYPMEVLEERSYSEMVLSQVDPSAGAVRERMRVRFPAGGGTVGFVMKARDQALHVAFGWFPSSTDRPDVYVRYLIMDTSRLR